MLARRDRRKTELSVLVGHGLVEWLGMEGDASFGDRLPRRGVENRPMDDRLGGCSGLLCDREARPNEEDGQSGTGHRAVERE
jgi:hypothetical protein